MCEFKIAAKNKDLLTTPQMSLTLLKQTWLCFYLMCLALQIRLLLLRWVSKICGPQPLG